jgi:hypothetical protein
MHLNAAEVGEGGSTQHKSAQCNSSRLNATQVGEGSMQHKSPEGSSM